MLNFFQSAKESENQTKLEILIDLPKSTEPSKKPIPHGREQIRKAILDATERLLEKRSPNEVTIREIAAQAQVKHPLIYRYFGAKSNLIMEAHMRGAEKIAAQVSDVQEIDGQIGLFYEAAAKNRWRQIALARAMIDGVDPHLLQNQFPMMQKLVALLKKRNKKIKGKKKYDADFLAAALAATALGWIIYEPFLVAATGLDSANQDGNDQQIIDFLDDIISKIE